MMGLTYGSKTNCSLTMLLLRDMYDVLGLGCLNCVMKVDYIFF